MPFQRKHLKILENRINEPRKLIQVIVGPRQIGKTTVVRQLTGKKSIPFHFVSADDVALGNSIWIQQQWEYARLKQRSEKATSFLLIIDEIQKISEWSATVKKLWDEDTVSKVNIKLILLGSSQLLLQTGLTESLAGRFETIYMGHWSFNEMHSAFGLSLNEFLWFGGYPGSAHLLNDEQRWRRYINDSLLTTTITKDIFFANRVNKPALLRRLFEIGSIYSSQILSFNKILGQLQDAGNTTTLAHYLYLLDVAGMLTGIEKYSTSNITKRSSSPKFNVQNNALFSCLAEENFQEILTRPEKWGRVVESAVGAHLINCSRADNFTIHYWRERNFEVDFIITRGSKSICLEVKSGRNKPATGLEQFNRQYNPYKILLVGSGGIPLKEFLSTSPGELF